MLTPRPLFVLAAACALTGAAHASVTLFSDDFDANTPDLNVTPAGWTLLSGAVDVIGNGFFDLLPGNGHYIDLDGSRGQGGTIGVTLNLQAGVAYTLSFDLAGSQRGDTNLVTVQFGSAHAQFDVASSTPFTTHALDFTAASAGPVQFSFGNAGGDNFGALLDRVQVTAVPEPAPALLLAAGLAALALRRRRR